MDKVEVAYASPDKQELITVALSKQDTVQQLINKSGILDKFPEINLLKMPVGIFGKVCKLNMHAKVGDRIEIYRPLQQNPMDARRNRAIKDKQVDM
ncbi:MAG: RnfH family protein [Methylococcales bacterium]